MDGGGVQRQYLNPLALKGLGSTGLHTDETLHTPHQRDTPHERDTPGLLDSRVACKRATMPSVASSK